MANALSESVSSKIVYAVFIAWSHRAGSESEEDGVSRSKLEN